MELMVFCQIFSYTLIYMSSVPQKNGRVGGGVSTRSTQHTVSSSLRSSYFLGGKATRARGPAACLQSTRARRPGSRPQAPGSRFPGSGSRHHPPVARFRVPDSGGRDHFTRTPHPRGTRGTIQPFPWNTRGTRSPEPGKKIQLFNPFYLSKVPVAGSFQPYAILTHY